MRIGIVTDIHENFVILQSAIDLASVHKCDELACLGDIVGFDTRFYNHFSTRSASRCIDLVRKNFRWTVAGNHDLFASGRFPTWSDGFSYPNDWFQIEPYKRKEAARGLVWCYTGESENDLGENELDFLSELPEFICSAETGIQCILSHYLYPDLSGSTTHYIQRAKELNKHWVFMDSLDVSFSFSGHTHNTFTGFAYRRKGVFRRAFHTLPNHSFCLGTDPVVISLPPLSGERGRSGFAIFDSALKELFIIPLLE